MFWRSCIFRIQECGLIIDHHGNLAQTHWVQVIIFIDLNIDYQLNWPCLHLCRKYSELECVNWSISFDEISFGDISFKQISFWDISFDVNSFKVISFEEISFQEISFKEISLKGISCKEISFEEISFWWRITLLKD